MIDNQTILDCQLEALLKNGMRDVVLVVGHEAGKIRDKVATDYPSINSIFVYNPLYAATNSAYSLWLASKHFGREFILLNSDVLIIEKIISLLVNSRKDNLLAIDFKQNLDEEAVKVSVNDEIVFKIGKNVETYCGEFMGISKFSGDYIDLLKRTLQEFAIKKQEDHFYVDAINNTLNFRRNIFSLDVSSFNIMEIDCHNDLTKALSRKYWLQKNET